MRGAFAQKAHCTLMWLETELHERQSNLGGGAAPGLIDS